MPFNHYIYFICMNNKINCDAIETISVVSWMWIACKRMEIWGRMCACVRMFVHWILFCHLNGFKNENFIILHWKSLMLRRCIHTRHTHTRTHEKRRNRIYCAYRVYTRLIPIYYCYYCVRHWMLIDVRTHSHVRELAEQKDFVPFHWNRFLRCVSIQKMY